MVIALFATFVNQTPLFENGAAGIVGGRKTLERGKIIELWTVLSPTRVRRDWQPGARVVCVPRSFSA